MTFRFEITVVEATRGSNCLDNVLINFKHHRNFKSGVHDPSLSDYSAVSIDVDSCRVDEDVTMRVSHPITSSSRLIFFDLISNSDWIFVDSDDFSLISKFDIFMNFFTNVVQVSFPERADRVKFYTDKLRFRWFTDDLRKRRAGLRLLVELKYNFPDHFNIKNALSLGQKSHKN
ncbi:hypothetical protein HHI36_023251 [Cryptolaemus montrouzieri]|uniref:Uncharacterized protein n=1 Tax=Cryptolaemus montrouzieri TaxID=559131 RepID=A0ABD2PG06_9CUCU